MACLLGWLLLSDVNGFAQNKGNGEKKAGLYVMVSTLPEKTEGSFSLVNLMGVQVYLTLSDGRRLSSVTSDQGTTFFKGVPSGGEYIAEVSAKGYSLAIYHGRVPAKIGFPKELCVAKSSLESEQEPSFFEDPGPADVEGFVVCPSEVFSWASEPMPDAFVLYTSSDDMLYTTTDQHGYFRFEGVKDKEGKVSLSYPGYKAAEATLPLEDDSRWLWVQMEKDL